MRACTRTLRKVVELWNAEYPVGSDVLYYPTLPAREHEAVQTKTASRAWLLGGHTPVVLIEGKSGCVALEHVGPID